MSETPLGDAAADSAVVGSERVLTALAVLAQEPAGISLDDLSRRLKSSKPTVHRALASLRRMGFAAKQGRGHYVLGDEFLRLAFAHHAARPDHMRVQSVLAALASRFQETAHYAVLDGRSVVYRAKVDPSAGAIRLSSVIGGRNPAHCTAVGKLLLSVKLPDEAAVADWIAGGPALEKRTEQTKTTAPELAAELAAIREQGYSSEDQENELGVSCLAVPVYLDAGPHPSGAVSISAVNYRTPLARLVASLEEVRSIVGPIAVPVR
ncbi:IclR family transcriptional regulator [Lentzea sp. NPDC059081]|uniref:IclR family transcriptional regulator n=1 Tax=Lentzea sp. NPDC059081 TaxID=3346719 RepID=UPI00368A792D